MCFPARAECPRGAHGAVRVARLLTYSCNHKRNSEKSSCNVNTFCSRLFDTAQISNNELLTCLNLPAIKIVGKSLAMHANGPTKLVPCQSWMLDACNQNNVYPFSGCSREARFECRTPYDNPQCTEPK